MLAIVLLILILAIFGGIGFAVHILWWIGIALLVLWVLGFFLGSGAGAGGRRGWYRW